jgi:Flp pilus assembly protein TadG
MTQLIRNARKKFARMERGQVLVIVALAAVGIVAIIGLVMDVGVLFIGNARLRRAVDAAALSAALQYRKNYRIADLTTSANEFLQLNGINDPNALVDTCDTDPDLCHDVVHDTTVQRKLVRVSASATVHLAFLPVIGINTAPISAVAISEAASVDVVLVIDRSESMTSDVDVGEKMRDPSYCNIHPEEGEAGNENAGGCQPFNDVQNAAVDFVKRLFYPYDRVAIVTFDKNPSDPPVLSLADDCPHPDTGCTAQEIEDHIVETIRNLTVFQGEETAGDPTGANAIYPNGNPSRYYGVDIFLPNPDPTDYLGMNCTQIWDPNDPKYPDPSPCTTTNIGKALAVGGLEFTHDIRPQALWAVVLLTDGMANAGYFDAQDNPETCPRDTWPDMAQKPIYCNDADSTTSHIAGSEEYDADDYAYDMADFVGLPAPKGQDALIFSIGLGKLVQDDHFRQADGNYYKADGKYYPGEEFLEYAADVGRGIYYYAEYGFDLPEIFRKIAENIATKLTH